MSTKKREATGKTFKEWIVSYFESTTIHGFHYVIASKSLFFKLFWIAAIMATFVVCSLFIKQTLDEVHRSAILSNSEDIVLDEVAFPAISVLAPKTLNPVGFDTRLLNLIDACDVNAHSFNALAEIQGTVKDLNEFIRNETLRTWLIPMDKVKAEKLLTFGWVGPKERMVYRQFCQRLYPLHQALWPGFMQVYKLVFLV